MSKKSNRSNGYQYIYTEQSFSNEMMAEFSESQGLNENLKPEDKEALLDLHVAQAECFWRLVDTELTERQAQVIRLLAQGYTQIEIAKQLKVNQSSITKSVNGNCDYRNGRKVYGGAKKKLRKLAKADPEIIEIMRKIAEIHAEYV